ncbi:LysR substrate-binding domain-containing protein [Paraburkholderia rhizosphaerae]|uniref:LysR substrate binding domain-containing protein n=1 Tax=Paraburkholderia rhizosphaerae TaxID=480658 RepID=A0A4R8LUN3_9BURK|nr:LysR substrate-binding domain-containing protein [Paraburkholderia rhizosphaerae]TDY51489.1 LysR substrate binding domain-containing protein [Paraburkholderia rhizosphaerae]
MAPTINQQINWKDRASTASTIALVRDPPHEDADLEAAPVLEGPMLLAIPEDHPLARNASPLAMTSLHKDGSVCCRKKMRRVSRPASCCASFDGSPIEVLWAASHRINLRTRVEILRKTLLEVNALEQL